MIQIGFITPWLKSYTNTPALDSKWVECNGQTLNDTDSPYHNQVIPNLNGTTDATKRFLRGSTTSGTTGGATTNTHTHGINTQTNASNANYDNTITGLNNQTINTIPSYYEVVYIMKIK